MVQTKKVAEIQREWEKRGSPPCDHPETEKEYDLGMQTGDTACLVCGESWWADGPPPSRGQDR